MLLRDVNVKQIIISNLEHLKHWHQICDLRHIAKIIALYLQKKPQMEQLKNQNYRITATASHQI